MQEHQQRFLRCHYDGGSDCTSLSQNSRVAQLPSYELAEVEAVQLEHTQQYVSSQTGKVLSKLGLGLTAADCNRLGSSTPGAIEALLFEFRSLAMENMKEKQDEERQVNAGLPIRSDPK